jgi:hypothetical protein
MSFRKCFPAKRTSGLPEAAAMGISRRMGKYIYGASGGLFIGKYSRLSAVAQLSAKQWQPCAEVEGGAEVKPIIGIKEDPEGKRISWHVVGIGPTDHATLCGVDGDDDNESVGQYGTVQPKRGQKIDCPQCKQIWLGVRVMRLTYRDFT